MDRAVGMLACRLVTGGADLGAGSHQFSGQCAQPQKQRKVCSGFKAT